jgi:hypothetical protein
MNVADIDQAFNDLLEWSRKRHFAGYDPFDALNSSVFQTTPLKHSQMARLLWTQLNKRSPFNLRRPTGIPPQRNAKGIALFTLATLANYRRLKTVEAEKQARELLTELLGMRIAGYSGAAWGYNFDWQSRQFFAPKGTPMIVPTAFAARTLIEAFEAFHDDSYLKVAHSACDFILEDLTRTVDSKDELCFSYSPLDQTQIFNASLLAADTLGTVGTLTGEAKFCEIAARAARYVVGQQRDDGSWAYGARPDQSWTDNFHTAYVLVSLARILRSCKPANADLAEALARGFAFWRKCFFLADGWPKYYHDSLYPADAHAAATAIVTLVELRELDPGALPLAETIATWTISNLRDRSGFFYYQRRRFYLVRTPFMRWTESWMLYALARLLEEKSQ